MLITDHQLASFSILLRSHRRVCQGKRFKASTLRFNFQLEHNLCSLEQLLHQQRFVPQPYTHFMITFPKQRHIAAPGFRDRIVHRALVDLIEPQLDRQFIHDSYACRKGRGVHFGLKRIKTFLRSAEDCLPVTISPAQTASNSNYFLKCDIKKYFQNISWEILLNILRQKIYDEKLFSLAKLIVSHHEVRQVKGKVMLQPQQVVSTVLRKGLPIGNLTSQLFANVYLNELDQFVKHTLKVRWYGRYMDDFLLIHHDKKQLKHWRDEIELFLQKNLALQLHPKKVVIQKTSQGVPFLGYLIFHNRVRVHGATLRRFRRRFRRRCRLVAQGKFSQQKLEEMAISFCGHLKHANGWGLRRQLLNQLQAVKESKTRAVKTPASDSKLWSDNYQPTLPYCECF